MKVLGKIVDSIVYGHLAVWLLSLAVLVLIWLFPSARDLLPLQLSGEQTTFYAMIAGMSATLLGFLLAVIALLAGLPDRRFVRKLREQGMLERAIGQVGRACFVVGLTIAASVAGLIVDRPPQEAAHEAAQLGCGSYWIWVVVLTGIPAAVLLTLSATSVIQVVTLATEDEAKGG